MGQRSRSIDRPIQTFPGADHLTEHLESVPHAFITSRLNYHSYFSLFPSFLLVPGSRLNLRADAQIKVFQLLLFTLCFIGFINHFVTVFER